MEDVGLPDNFMLRPWLPQKDIISHEKTKLFVTHCGANGVVEGMYSGTPMLGFPQMFEQRSACLRLKHLGVGQVFNDKTDTVESLAEKIRSIAALNSPEASRVTWVKDMMRYEEQEGKQDVAYWVEYFARFGTSHL